METVKFLGGMMFKDLWWGLKGIYSLANGILDCAATGLIYLTLFLLAVGVLFLFTWGLVSLIPINVLLFILILVLLFK